MTGSLEQRGLTPRAVSELFSSIGNMKDSTVTVRSYFVELYNDQLVDLYSKLGGNVEVKQKKKESKEKVM